MDYPAAILTLRQATGLPHLTQEQDDLIAALVGCLPEETLTSLAELFAAIRTQVAARHGSGGPR